jgi:colanic acid/amylovoran biosynthesis glycosyltransferase
MARLIEKQQRNYDVLHAHFGPVAESFRFARELWGAPFIASFHGYDFTTVPRKEGKHVYKKLFAVADAITANSAFTVQRLVELGCPKEKVRRLPMGLDPQQFDFRERALDRDEPVRILVVARLTPIKGVGFAIDAVSEVRKRYSNIQLDIVGDGPLRPELEQRTRKLGLDNMVRFHGALSGKALQGLRDAAHILLHLSVTVDGDQEGQGVVLQEAQAVGLPVIATRHGAFPEGVLEAQSAFLVPERDPHMAADVLLFLIENPQVWPEMGRKGRAFVEANYDIRRLNEALLELYREVIDKFQRT